ncbi:MAG: L,D-transpeptidase family protein [Clostridiales bacterium]|nr:L,D-transpeptidase family protein [Clostridiales bacterium]
MGFIAGLRIAPARADAPERIIIINTSGNTLTLYENGQLAKKYIVASGRHSSPTPTGIYKIVSKSRNWGSGFGSRFMRINVPWGLYGIHGTNRPGLIGSDVSAGCIRMRNTDVEDLYKRVEVGTPVLIEASPYGFLDFWLTTLGPGDRCAAVMEVQKRLNNLGYDTGTPDGIFGDRTKAALLRFKRDRGLAYTHYVDQATYRALGIMLFE